MQSESGRRLAGPGLTRRACTGGLRGAAGGLAVHLLGGPSPLQKLQLYQTPGSHLLGSLWLNSEMPLPAEILQVSGLPPPAEGQALGVPWPAPGTCAVAPATQDT